MRPETATLAGEFTACMLQQGHYNPDQPRAPQGTTIGGRWIAAGQTATQAPRKPKPGPEQPGFDLAGIGELAPGMAAHQFADPAEQQAEDARLRLLADWRAADIQDKDLIAAMTAANERQVQALERVLNAPRNPDLQDISPERRAWLQSMDELGVLMTQSTKVIEAKRELLQGKLLAAKAPLNIEPTLRSEAGPALETARKYLPVASAMIESTGANANLYGLPTVEIRTQDGVRSSAGGKVMWLAANAGATTVVHETGHYLEESTAGLRGTALAYLERRTKGEPLVKLRDVMHDAGYGDTELARPDKFMHPYTGKIYPPGGIDQWSPAERANTPSIATEVISMGLQQMHEDPVRFAEGDPDHWRFTYRVMKGTWASRGFQ